ncbi:nucleoside diphosphate kinase [Kwoniella dejecticola CBS 10117]|uniref:Nucleoside diphosphate kinase n=1 Tax=Kwoniella dejecticola CBS 10117 TaxID=1296121 RepID=A0A1A5ZXM3_9TREE|nr:nucleoside diphosphate kinase [Kwoniella dejecticola CBS 10117]OBR82553.1 nucleoside diphosphate kinase [Kwoniella dejecticola CBS 10117]
MSTTEQTYIMIKPDGVQRGLVGEIIARFEKRGFKLAALKLASPSKEHLEKHYADLSDKKFFPGLIKYMLSGPVVCMVWEGLDAVKTGRTMLGATNPLASAPGTIRGDYALQVGMNVCHGSDSVENGQKEIALWFPEGVSQYKLDAQAWIYEA